MKEINIASTIIAKRREKGVTQDELAEYIGVSKASVSKWETGQSYPDITFLPQLATYFNITIDELMNYTPQMTKEDIRKLYHRLSALFAELAFNDVLTECREIIKKYYSCFPLLFQMSVLLLNHHMLAESDSEKESIVREAAGLCSRIKTESGDVWLAKDATHMQAMCYLTLKDPQTVLDLLGEDIKINPNGELLISNAYQLLGNVPKAKEILQLTIYSHIGTVFGALINYLYLCSDSIDKSEEIIKRMLSLADTFNMAALNPSTTLYLYLHAAIMYCANGRTETALEMLDKYADACTTGFFPYTLHGDDFFDLIDGWLSELDLGTDAPRSEKVIKESMVKDALTLPAFDCLKDNREYVRIVKKLENFLGGI